LDQLNNVVQAIRLSFLEGDFFTLGEDIFKNQKTENKLTEKNQVAPTKY
jgi:hypothetical protein